MSDNDPRINNLEAVIREKDKRIEDLEGVIKNKDNKISNLEDIIRGKDIDLNNIYNSQGWKALLFYYKLRNKILPPDSKRGIYARIFWRVCSDHLKHWLRLTLPKLDIRKPIYYIRYYGTLAFVRNIWWRLVPKNLRIFYKPNVPDQKLPEAREQEIKSQENITISVVIPTKNAGSDFECLLSILRGQKGLRDVEIIVVDSGSTDETVKIAKAYGAKIIEIPPDKFSHSYSRNIGAENASGEYLFITVQDALPSSTLFLHELLGILKNKEVTAVSCAEFPREDVDLFYSVQLWNHYKFLEVDKNDRILSLPETMTNENIRKNGQLSDLACLISRDTFMKYKFRGDYAEDLDLGIRLIKDGHKFALLNSIKIIHSHNRPPYYYLKRAYVDNIFLTRGFPDYSTPIIEEHRLFRDISQAYHSIKTIINEKLEHINVPVGIKELFDIVGENISLSTNTDIKSASAFDGCPQVDDNTKSFLSELCSNNHITGEYDSGDGFLTNAVLNHMKIVKVYMELSYPQVDQEKLEDFKSCIAKVFALQCGAHLAYCYLSGSSVVKDLHKQLMGEI